jgi:branched-chain amino acid transport system substrate-binding protein
MSQRWSYTTLALGLLVCLVMAGCAGPGPSKGEVIVYVAVPLSGWQADGGQTVLGGARLAAEQINQKGGVLGYRVQVVPVDDEADTDVAIEVANDIASAVRGGKRVLGVIGHYNSGQAAAALQIYKDLPIIVVTPTASDPALTQQGYLNFFRVNATDAAQGPYAANFMVNDLKAQRIVVVYAENDYGIGLRDELVEALKGLGRVPVEVIGIEEAADTHAPVLPRIQAANADTIFLAGYETEGYILLPELREAGIQAQFMASDGCFLYEFIDGSGRWAEGVYVSAITPDSKLVADKDWWRAYQSVEARNPGTYSVAGYSAMTVLIEGAKRANSLDAAAIRDILHREPLTTLAGVLRYDQYGDLTEQRVYIFQVRDDDFVQVRPAK